MTSCHTPTTTSSYNYHHHSRCTRIKHHLSTQGNSLVPGLRHSWCTQEPYLSHCSCYCRRPPCPTLHLLAPALVPCRPCVPSSHPASLVTSNYLLKNSWTSTRSGRTSVGSRVGRRWRWSFGMWTAPSVMFGKTCQDTSTATGTPSAMSYAPNTSALPQKANSQGRSSSTSPPNTPGSTWGTRLTSSTTNTNSMLKARSSSAQVG